MTRQQKRRRPTPRRRLLGCEHLESRQLLAADGLDALDDLSFIPADADDVSTITASAESDPGSLGAYLNDLAADPGIQDGPQLVAAIIPPAARHNPVDPLDVDVSGTVTPRDALLVINHLSYGDPSLTQPDDVSAPGVFDTDVNGDGQITPTDALQVITAINAMIAPQGGEGEGMSVMALPPLPIPGGDAALPYITKAEVENLLARAAGATSTVDAIIAIVDRGGHILGVRMEQGVLNNIPDTLTRVFAIDGAVAKARTAAFFANNQAPLTSRTIRSLSQSTITEREVESNPTVPNPLDPMQNPFVNA